MQLYTLNNAIGVLPRWLRQTLLVMRITTLILLAALMQVSAFSVAQKVNFVKKNASLEQVFNEISKQTGYNVLLPGDKLNIAQKIDANFTNASITTVLNQTLSNLDFSFVIEDNTIVIKPKEPSILDKLSTVISNMVRDLTVKGRVVDQEGKPLPNASIRVKGKSAVTNTNQNGEFELKGVEEDAVLLVSYVGFKTLEIPLKDAVMPLEIKLNVATGELEEVKVTYSTGYQEIAKERATGSFVQIDNKLFNRAVGNNVLDRILNVTSSLKYDKMASNLPNGSDIAIRGFSTINANKKPLIVVDGFPYEEIGPDAGHNYLNNLNPNDVESITILRDAASASIWGARSGNGVIVINTKKGKYNQETNIVFNSSFNLVEKPRLDKMNVIKPMDAIEFEKTRFATGMYNEYDDFYPSMDYFPVLSPTIEILLLARKRNSSIPNYNALTDPKVITELAMLGSNDSRDDVSKYLLQTALNQQYALNISGGNDKMKYYGSVGYDKNMAVNKGDQDNRLTLRFDNTYRPIKNLEINTFLVYTKGKNTSNAIDYTNILNNAARYSRLADNMGNPLHVPLNLSDYLRTPYLDTAAYPALLDGHYRPLDEMKNNDNTSNLYNIRLGGGIKYTLLQGISIEINSQYEKELSNVNKFKNLNSYETRSFINQFMFKDDSGRLNYPFPLGGVLDFTNAERTNWNVRAKLMVNKSWSNHQLNIIAGAETAEATYNFRNGRKYGYDPNTSTDFSAIDYSNFYPTRASWGTPGKIPTNNSFGGTLNRYVSYFANGGYTFANKYTLTASGRIDASNFFGSKANQRIVPLWSSGIAWDISKEEFYEVNWLPNLRLSITYGYNANLNNKATALPTANYNPAQVGNGYHTNVTLALSTPPNPGLTWERIKNINVAVDYGFLGQRINGKIEYYSKKGIDLIGEMLADATVGVNRYTTNYASMKSSGFDVQLNTLNLNRKLRWSSNFNLSYNTDKVTDYEISELNKNRVTYYVGSGFQPILGKPLLKIYSYPDAGLDPLNGNPRGYVSGEVKGFNEVLQKAKPEDLIYHGSASPKITGNMINTFDYKNISLSFNIGIRLKYYIRKSSILYADLFNRWGNAHADYALRWQTAGDEQITSVPSLPDNYDGRDNFYTNSSSLVLKGDHIRLNDIRLAYNLNKSVRKHLPFSNASIYIYASNLGVLWKANKDGIDPDYPNTTLPPTSRNVALGLNLNF